MVNNLEKNKTTLIITSCGRIDLLNKTVESLNNRCDFDYKIIIEDSGDIKIIEQVNRLFGADFLIYANEKNIGQIASIDKVYSEVTTQYIFHCEDDWVFTREGFLEESKKILEVAKDISMVSLRDWEQDVVKNCSVEICEERKTLDGVEYFKLKPTKNGMYGGYSFNPGLRRTIDYINEGPFIQIGHEREISLHFIKKSMTMGLLKESATNHIGWDRHIFSKDNSAEKYYLLKKWMPNLVRMLKALRKKW